MKTSCAVCAVVVGSVLSAGAAEYAWTGASDGYWTNAANWTVSGAVATVPPGRYLSSGESGVVTNGVTGDTATFGPVGAGAATTVNVDGVVSVLTVKFDGAETPAYTIGLAATPNLKVEASGGVKVEKSVSADQVFNARVATSGTEYWTNDGTGLLRFANGFNGHTDGHYMYFYGTGDISIAKNFGNASRVYLRGTGRLICDGTTTGNYFKMIYADVVAGLEGKWRHIEITSGSYLRTHDGSKPSVPIAANENILVDGAGTFQPGVWNGEFRFTVASGKTMTIRAANLVVHDGESARLSFFRVKGEGTLNMETPCKNWYGQHVIEETGTLATDLIGVKGCAYTASHIGKGNVSIGYQGSGTFAYTGAGETTDRDLGLLGAVTGTLRNSGTGTLTWNGSVTQAVAGASVRIDAATAPIVFGGDLSTDFPVGLILAGSKAISFGDVQEGVNAVTIEGVYTLPSFDLFPDATCYRFAGGDLTVPATDGTSVMQGLALASGTGVLRVPDGSTLRIASVQSSGGKLNIVRGDSVSIQIEDQTGFDLESVTIDGYKVAFDTDGKTLVPLVSDWKAAEDGSWSEAEKWTAGVPSGRTWANITAAGADYTVSVDEEPSFPFGMRIGTGSADATATLSFGVSSLLRDVVCELAAGGAIAVTDGELTVTNTAAGAGSFVLPANSKFLASGTSRVRFAGPAADFVQDGGDIVFSDHATNLVVHGFCFGSGHALYTNSAALRTTGTTLSLKPCRAGETCEVTLAGDETSLHSMGTGTLIVNRDVAGGRSVLNTSHGGSYDWSKGLFGGVPYYTAIGYRNGYGELNHSKGRYNGGNNGVAVAGSGHGYVPVSGDCHSPTGVLNITGGSFDVGAYGNPYQKVLCGLIVGDGTRTSAGVDNFYRGTVNLSKGTLQPGPGYVIIGAGSAYGDLVQTGGALNFNSSDSHASYPKADGSTTFRYEFVVGLAGGKGEYLMSAGTATLQNRMWIGGIPAATLGSERAKASQAEYYPSDRHDADGLFRMSGGTFSSTTNVIVGADGKGVLEFSGTSSFACRELALSNRMETALSFVLPEAVTPGWKVSVTNLFLASGAKLRVDATAAARKRGRTLQLLSSKLPVEGRFAAEDVSVDIGGTDEERRAFSAECEVLYEMDGANGLWLKLPKSGLTILIR